MKQSTGTLFALFTLHATFANIAFQRVGYEMNLIYVRPPHLQGHKMVTLAAIHETEPAACHSDVLKGLVHTTSRLRRMASGPVL